jgi:hypothetical protein
MKIYKVIPDKDTFGTLVLDGDMLRKSLGRRLFMGLSGVQESISDKWPEIDGFYCSLYDDSDISEYPDVSVFMGSLLALSSEAKHKLEPALSAFGEFLNFRSDKGPYFLFVPHTVMPVDQENSEILMVDGVPSGPKTIAFLPENVGTNSIFKTDFDHFTGLYCSERLKSLVESNDLTGVFFTQNLAATEELV